MTLRCSICGESYEFDDKGGELPPHFPFCSSRCKAIDLGNWFNEGYRISTSLPSLQSMTDEERETFMKFLSEAKGVDAIKNNDE